MVKDMPNKFSEVTPEIKELAKKCNKKIDEELFAKYDVKRGLRKRNGEGVLAGLTFTVDHCISIDHGNVS